MMYRRLGGSTRALALWAKPSATPAPTTVHKFGGSSVGSADAFRAVLGGILTPFSRARRRPIAVLSAMLGVTDRLREAATAASQGRMSAVRELRGFLRSMHMATLEDLVLDRSIRTAAAHGIDRSLATHFDETCERIASLRVAEPLDVDSISSAGERWSSALLVALMADRGVDGQLFEGDAVVVTDGIPGNSRPLLAETQARLEATVLPSLERGAIPVVTGFFGASAAGVLTTLGRGGTDLSAAVVGACVGASEVLLWKVECSLLADGRMRAWEAGWEGVVHDATPAVCIPALTYDEAAALAHLGKKVLHPDTVLPAVELGIPIGVRNTLSPAHPGTRIGAETLPPRVPGLHTLGGAPPPAAFARIRTVTSTSVAAYEARHHRALDVDWAAALPPGFPSGGKTAAGLVALVGTHAALLGPALFPRVSAVLRAAGVREHAPLPPGALSGEHALVVVVPEAARKVAVRALHGAFAAQLGAPFEIHGDGTVESPGLLKRRPAAVPPPPPVSAELQRAAAAMSA